MTRKGADRPGAKSGERIAKVMARAGLCSRREAEALIVGGQVRIDGKRADAGARDQALRVDVAIAVHVADIADRGVRGVSLRALAGVDVAVRGEQVDVAALRPLAPPWPAPSVPSPAGAP